ncbi:hypothetical protein DM02DRAFT_487336, partial [Periconia macrospinosa]
FQRCLEKTEQFENLREFRLRFNCACINDYHRHFETEVAETIRFRTQVLLLAFETLARGIRSQTLPHFDTLTLENLQDSVSTTVYASKSFATVLSRIKKLHLSIATEYDEAAPEETIEKPACHKMFTHDLINRWLLPVQHHLTHLSIYGTSCLWGFYPFCDLRRTHFPYLQSLSLGNYTIAHTWQIDWILSHSSTLQELYLDYCPLLTIARLTTKEVTPHWPDLP